MHQNRKGKKTRGGENLLAPVSQKERGESRSWISEQFRSSWNQLQCTCQNSDTTPLSCHVYQEKIAFKFNAYTSSQHVRPYTPPNLFVGWSSNIGRKTVRTVSNVHQNNSRQRATLCSSKNTKMHISASEFSKIFRGSMPRTPQRVSGFARAFIVCMQVDWCLEIFLLFKAVPGIWLLMVTRSASESSLDTMDQHIKRISGMTLSGIKKGDAVQVALPTSAILQHKIL